MKDPLTLYLEEIGRTPLLSAEEERQLFLRLRAAKEAMRRARGPAAQRQARRRVDEARAPLLRANLRLVVKIARAYRGRGLPLEDLIAEGNLGLYRGINGFCLDRGCRLSTYATWWIRQCIRRAVENQARLVRVPTHALRLMVDWQEVSSVLTGELGREPTAAEIAARLGLDPGCAEALARTVARALRAGGLQSGGDDENGPECLPERQPPAPLPYDQRERLAAALRCLPQRDQRVIVLRFGLGEERPHTLEETGRCLGVTRERVRQIEARALTKMRAFLESQRVCC